MSCLTDLTDPTDFIDYGSLRSESEENLNNNLMNTIGYSDFIIDFSKILRPAGRPRLFSVTQISQIPQILLMYGSLRSESEENLNNNLMNTIGYSDFIIDFSKILRPAGRPRLFSVTQISQIPQIVDQNLLYDVLSRCQSWSCFSTVICEI